MADAYGINWGAIEQPNILGGYLQGREYRQKQEQNVLDRQRQTRVDERQDKVWQREDDQIANRKTALGAYGKGDKAKAKQSALDAGDTELWSAMESMDEAGRKQAATRNEKVGSIAFDILHDPSGRPRTDQEIAAAFEAAKPMLSELFPPEKLTQVPSRDYLTSLIGSTMTLKEKLDLFDKNSKLIETDPTKNYYKREGLFGSAPAGGSASQVQGGEQGGERSPPRSAGLYRDAIANIESRGSGDYKAQGPVTGSGDRAYGRYQVMGANIPQWTREALGREMTPQEFLASPEAQDKVFDHRFGGYVQKYGSPEEAASVWFTGQPRSKGGSRRDQLGTSGDQYVQQFAQNLAAPTMPGRETATDAPQIPGYRQIQVGRPKPGKRPATAAEKAQYGLGASVSAEFDPSDGSIKVLKDPSDKPPKEPTADAKKTASFTYRSLTANDRLNALIRQGITKPTAWKLVSDRNGVTRLSLSNQNDRRFVSAAKEWLAPVLRKDTGAAVTDQEFLYYADMFIPAPEDGPELLRQKAEARQDAMKAMAGEAGPLYSQTYGKREFKAHWAADRAPKAPAQGAAQPSGGWGKMTVR